MILLDTHIWVWWVHLDARLTEFHQRVIRESEPTGIGVSVISCWEVAKLVEYGRITLPLPIAEWMELALAYPGVQLVSLTPLIAIKSSRLPGPFHRDPADQIIVATARVLDCPLLTADARILAYPRARILNKTGQGCLVLKGSPWVLRVFRLCSGAQQPQAADDRARATFGPLYR